MVYDYDDGRQHYRVIYEREKDILAVTMAEVMPEQQVQAARAAGFDMAYLRFTGQCTVEKIKNGVLVETQAAPSIWELMYPGMVSENV
jgi:hypothetical protein